MMRIRYRSLLAMGLCLAAGTASAQTNVAPVIDASRPAATTTTQPRAAAPAGATASPLAPAGPAAIPPQNQALIEVLTRLQQLQEEVREMRGEMEVQSHAIENLNQRQRDLYLDVDRRLRRVETGGQIAAPAVAPGAASPPVTTGTPGAPAPTTTPGSGAPAATATDPAQEQAAYQLAFNLLKEGRYQRAIGQFQEFLARYPGGTYADNAQYWLGEANYVTRNFTQAIDEFRKVLTGFPDSPKGADALLKIGYAQYELQQWQDARATLTEIGQRYPQSTAARLAENRLQRMKSEGR